MFVEHLAIFVSILLLLLLYISLQIVSYIQDFQILIYPLFFFLLEIEFTLIHEVLKKCFEISNQFLDIV